MWLTFDILLAVHPSRGRGSRSSDGHQPKLSADERETETDASVGFDMRDLEALNHMNNFKFWQKHILENDMVYVKQEYDTS